MQLALREIMQVQRLLPSKKCKCLVSGDVSRTAQTFRLLQMARITKALRVIRVFKLARHSIGLKALGNTLTANIRELGLLFLLLFIGAIVFASLVFVFEKDTKDTAFKTMFDAYWWAMITMTTVSRNIMALSKISVSGGIWGRGAQDGGGSDAWLLLCHLRGPHHRPSHTHHRKQLHKLLQSAKDIGEEGNTGQKSKVYDCSSTEFQA